MRVVILEDDDAIRYLLSTWLKSLPEVREVVPCASLEDFQGVHAEGCQGCSLAMIDIRLGNDNGVEALRTCIRLGNVPRTVVLMSGTYSLSETIASEASEALCGQVEVITLQKPEGLTLENVAVIARKAASKMNGKVCASWRTRLRERLRKH